MTITLKVTEFSAAVRGYQYYGSIWFPEKGEQLDCSHDFSDVFDVFTIKPCKTVGAAVCHLPGEISRATKFLLDPRVQISAILDRYVKIVKVNYIEPKHEVILGSFLKKLSTATQPTNKKRNTSNNNNPKKKQKPNRDIK